MLHNTILVHPLMNRKRKAYAKRFIVKTESLHVFENKIEIIFVENEISLNTKIKIR